MTLEKAKEIVNQAIIDCLKCKNINMEGKKLLQAMKVIEESEEK